MTNGKDKKSFKGWSTFSDKSSLKTCMNVGNYLPNCSFSNTLLYKSEQE